MVCGTLFKEEDTLKLSISNTNQPLVTVTEDGRLVINISALTLDEVAEQFLEILEQKINKKVKKIEYV